MQILYIHGLGGGGDSRIPAILSAWFSQRMSEVELTVRTYDFDPEKARTSVAQWVDELKPDLIVGESMGASLALGIAGIPHLLVSPALGAPILFYRLAWLCRVPGVSALLNRIYKPRPGDRQQVRFTYTIMKKWRQVYRDSMTVADSDFRAGMVPFAFFGRKDHYLKWGIVRPGDWGERYGPDSFEMYEGSHFMEEEYILDLLIPRICDILFRK